jgi:hypothetical protein
LDSTIFQHGESPYGGSTSSDTCAVDEDEDSQAGTDSGGEESDGTGEVFSDDEDAHARLIVGKFVDLQNLELHDLLSDVPRSSDTASIPSSRLLIAVRSTGITPLPMTDADWV